MWACAAFCSQGPTASRPWSDSLVAFLPAGADQWGRPQDTQIPGRTGSTPNEGYFEQFLAWFGGAVMAGRFTNVWDEMQHPLALAPGGNAPGPTGIGNIQGTSLRGYECDGRRVSLVPREQGQPPTPRTTGPVFLLPDLKNP
jgi:hypothetical protein